MYFDDENINKLNNTSEEKRFENVNELITAAIAVIDNSEKIKKIMRSYNMSMHRIGFNYTRVKDIIAFSLMQAQSFDEKKKVFIELMKQDKLYKYLLNNESGYRFMCSAENTSDAEKMQLFDILFERIITTKKDSAEFLKQVYYELQTYFMNYLVDNTTTMHIGKDNIPISYFDNKFKQIYDKYGHDMIYSNKKFKTSTEHLLLLINHMSDEEILYIISLLHTGMSSYDFSYKTATDILKTTKFSKEVEAQGFLINLKDS